MKILVSAYSCLPHGGSEPGIGWNWARSIAASGHEVTVLTRSLNRNDIESYLENHSAPPMRFVYHELPVWKLMYKLPFGNYLYYLLWQRTAASLALKLHRQDSFDRVQHITWGSFRMPSFMGKLGIPFTFGPVGGGEDTPPRLRSGLGWQGRLWDAVRRISNATVAPWTLSTYRSATEIVATTDETLSRIPAEYRTKCWSRMAVGIDPGVARQNGSHVSQRARHRNGTRLELLFVGRLLPWKGVHLMLKALARLGASERDIHLTIVGGGNDASRLRRLAQRLKLDAFITWVEWMPRESVIRMYSQFDLFTFPSLHDSGGMAVLEAMTFGLPVVCLDLGGPAMAVNDRCGRVISTKNLSEERVADGIAQFLAEILADRASLDRLSEGARMRAASLTWQANVEAVYGGAMVSQAS